MNQSHVSREQLKGMLSGEGPRGETLDVVSHLLTGCEVCQRLASKVVAEMDARGEPYLPHFCLLIATERKAIEERAAAREQWLELQALNQEQRKTVIRNRASFQTWGLFSRLNSYARIIVREDGEQALEAAELSLFVAMHLEPQNYGKKLITDAKIAAFTELGNAKRVLEDFEPAETHLQAAQDWLAEGTGDPMITARLASVRASLLIDLGEFEGAAVVLERVASVNRKIHDWHEYAKAKIQQAAAFRQFDPVQGYKAARLGLRTVDASDRFTYLCGVHNLIDCMNEAGEHGEALLLFQKHKRELEECESHKMMFSTAWLEARINKGIALLTGQLSYMEAAEAALLGLEIDYTEHDLFQETALVQLDLVEMYAAMGQLPKSITTAMRAYQILKLKGLHTDAQQTWLYLHKALSECFLSQGIITQARRVLSRYWKGGIPDSERLE